MPKDVIMPALGMNQDTGILVRWLKEQGDSVAQGEPLMEVETDKAVTEIESPGSGTLSGITAQPGDEVPVGQTIAVILAPGEAAPEPSEQNIAPETQAAPAAEHAAPSPAEGPRGGPMDGRVLASPKARRLAKEHRVDLANLAGSGPDAAVLAADVLVAGGTAAADTVPVSRAWHVMVRRLTQSWTEVPHFYLAREVDASALRTWREREQGRHAEKITYTDLLIKVVALGLLDHPRLNATWRNDSIQRNDDINLGLAVATEDGLLVPVIARANQLEIGEIAARRLDLVTRAQAGTLTPHDMQSGTFTITNLGMYGVDAFQAIVNPPQAAILALGRIADRIVAVDGQPAVRPTLILTLSCDHRAVDGARASRFLQTLAELIESPSGG